MLSGQSDEQRGRGKQHVSVQSGDLSGACSLYRGPMPRRVPHQQPHRRSARLRGGDHAPGNRSSLLRTPCAHPVPRRPQLLPDVGTEPRSSRHHPLHGLRADLPGRASARGLHRGQRCAAAMPRHHPQGLCMPAHAAASQRLLPLPPASRRHRGSRAGAPERPREPRMGACSWASTSAAPSPTPF